MHVHKEIMDAILFEWREIRHDYDDRTLDLVPTAMAVWTYLESKGTMIHIENLPEHWQRAEATHQAVSDWFSSFEPKTKARAI
jgi:hypothetical protein